MSPGVLVTYPWPVPSLIEPDAIQIAGGTCVALPLIIGQSYALTKSCHIAVLKGGLTAFGAYLESEVRTEESGAATHLQFHEYYRPSDDITPIIIRAVASQATSKFHCNVCGALCLNCTELCESARQADTVVLIRKHFRCSISPLLGIQNAENGLRIPEEWEVLAQSWKSLVHVLDEDGRRAPRSFLIAGGTGMGKSTLALWMANSFVREGFVCALLDMDPGQPMFGVPGCLTLFIMVEPFLSLHNPSLSSGPLKVRSIYIGHTSPEGGVLSYLEAAHALLSTYRRLIAAHNTFGAKGNEDKVNPPVLLVNTPGWVAGTGWQLIDALGSMAQAERMVVLTPPTGSTDEPNCPPRNITGLAPTFAHFLLQKNEAYVTPWFATEPAARQICEMQSVVTGDHFGPERFRARIGRILGHLFEFDGPIPDDYESCRRARLGRIPRRLGVPIGDCEFRTPGGDSIAWRQGELQKYNLTGLFGGALVAVEQRNQDGYEFICLAVSCGINWVAQQVVLAVSRECPPIPPRLLRLSLASRMLPPTVLQYCAEWAEGISGLGKNGKKDEMVEVLGKSSKLRSRRITRRVRV